MYIGLNNLGLNGRTSAFSPSSLFTAGEQGAWFAAYNPDSLLMRRNLLPNSVWAGGGAVPTTWVSGGSGTAATAGTAADGVSTIYRMTAVAQRPYFAWSAAYSLNGGATAATLSVYVEAVHSGALTLQDIIVLTGTGLTATFAVDGVTALGSAPLTAGTRVSATFTGSITSSSIPRFGAGVNNTVTGDISISRPQYEVGATATTYQKVTDWTTEYLAAASTSVGMWQESTGVTPVTAVEQPVGLWMDTRLGMVQGVELRANGVASLLGVATAASYNTTTGDGVVTRVDASNQSYINFTGLTANGWYRVSVTNGAGSGGTVNVRQGGPSTTVAFSAIVGGSASGIAQASGSGQITITTAAGTSTFTGLTIREIPGNHATQATSASRPTLSARYNLLTKTEQFDDAAWTKVNSTITANATTAPDGTMTADKIVAAVATGLPVQHRVDDLTRVVAITANHVFTVSLKAAEYGFARIRVGNGTTVINLTSGAAASTTGGWTATTTPTGDGWWRVSLAGPALAGDVVRVNAETTAAASDYVGDDVSGIYVWGADLRTAADAALNIPAYQRVNTATDYDTVGFFHYLRFDGVDDSLATAAIDFSATDKMTVWAGVTKLSDAAAGVVVELTATAITTPGSFAIYAPAVGAATRYDVRSGGTLFASSNVTGFAAPINNVVTMTSDISGDRIASRVDGSPQTLNTDDQGTGNYSNAAANIGRRNNSNIPFNGRIIDLIVRGVTSNTTEIISAERYVGAQMGINL